ncbi:hypothetical protein BMW23_0486 [Bodo saltans virus]|uniref:Uncharacterized protein n=1 Tax=Bodo saltans virus TaxID=2024608 RepID=A0A2H4UUJ4_9VIRU|nr:hypothetical protein QJ851_gp0473 [Bodo saltans virus]ATZ80536.1 hypothetical protein BMW23_0486 [Bodo saltans virus]
MDIVNSINTLKKALESEKIKIKQYDLSLKTFVEIIRKNKLPENNSDSEDEINSEYLNNFPINDSENSKIDDSIQIEPFSIPAHIYDDIENDTNNNDNVLDN